MTELLIVIVGVIVLTVIICIVTANKVSNPKPNYEQFKQLRESIRKEDEALSDLLESEEDDE